MAKAKPVKAGKSDSNETVCAVLSYFIVGIIWYFVDEKMKKSSLARFHAKQGLVLLLAAIIVNVVGSIIFWIPIVGWLLMFVVQLVILVLWVMGIVYSATGKETELPVIGGLAKKLSF